MHYNAIIKAWCASQVIPGEGLYGWGWHGGDTAVPHIQTVHKL